jgi:hypothetical protein
MTSDSGHEGRGELGDQMSTGGEAAREGQPNQDRAGGEDRAERPGRGDRIDRVSRGDRADRGARWNRGDQPYLDAQVMSDLDTQVYEAIATLEFSGRPVTIDEVAEATGLDGPAVGEILEALAGQGTLTRRRSDAGESFELSRRDWSATPETPSR